MTSKKLSWGMCCETYVDTVESSNTNLDVIYELVDGVRKAYLVQEGY